MEKTVIKQVPGYIWSRQQASLGINSEWNSLIRINNNRSQGDNNTFNSAGASTGQGLTIDFPAMS